MVVDDTMGRLMGTTKASNLSYFGVSNYGHLDSRQVAVGCGDGGSMRWTSYSVADALCTLWQLPYMHTGGVVAHFVVQHRESLILGRNGR